MLTSMPQLPFKDVVGNDGALLQFIEYLEVKGVCILNDVPHQLGQVRTLAERVAFIKRTHYITPCSSRERSCGEQIRIKFHTITNDSTYNRIIRTEI